MNAHSRSSAALAIAVLIGGGLVAFTPPEPATAADPVADAAPAPQRYLVSQTATGVSDQPALSSDGQHVAFVSTEALVPGDTDGVADVYVATAAQGSSDPFSGAPELVSRPDRSSGLADGASSEPSISADGRYVVFTSTATNLVPGATTSGRRQVYVRDTVVGSTTMIAVGGVEPDGDSYSADISANGRSIVFVSTASNLAAGDTDGLPDIFVVDRDADGDGSYTTQSIRIATPQGDFGPTTTSYANPRISGNGASIVYGDTRVGDAGRPGNNMYWAPTDTLVPDLYDRFGRTAAIDYSGTVIAEVSMWSACGPGDVVIVRQQSTQTLATAVGTLSTLTQFGSIQDVAISADASTVAWSGTQPDATPSAGPEGLPQPVVRIEHPSFPDAWGNGKANSSQTFGGGVACTGLHREPAVTIGVGADASLSAGGRTVAYADPPDLSPGAVTSVRAVDTRSSNGLSVTTTEGHVLAPMYLTSYPTASISPAAIHDYGAAFADAPIHRVPIHRVPIHRVPIHRVPIHRVPIHRVDLPGGWTQLLVGTPFEGQSDLTVTLGDVLDWADATAASGTATAAQKAAAARIESLTLDDVDLDGSGIDALSLGALVLGDAPVSQVAIAGTGSVTARWQATVDAQGVTATVDAQTVLADLDYAGVDVGRTGVDAVPLNSLPISQTVLDAFPITATDGDVGLQLGGTLLGALDVGALSDPGRIFDGPVTGTISGNLPRVRAGATAADLAAVAPASVTFGDFLATLLDSASYPWEQISPAALDPGQAGSISNTRCEEWGFCERQTWYTFAFDPGPGEATTFPQAIAAIAAPSGTWTTGATVSAAGPAIASTPTVATTPTTTAREHTTYALGDVTAGSVYTYTAKYQVTSIPQDGSTSGTVTSGGLTATLQVPYSRELNDYHNQSDPGLLQEGVVYYGWLAPQFTTVDGDGNTVNGPIQSDTWSVAAPPAGKRLVVSTNATDGQVSIALYRASADATDLGVADLGGAPGTGAAQQSATTTGAPSESGTDAGAGVDGSVLIDQSTISGAGAAEIEAAGVDTTPGETLTVRVTSANGLPSTTLYSVRVQYMDEPTGPVCAPWTPAQTADPGVVGTSDPVADDTNTLYLTDTKRFGDTWGATGAASVRSALEGLDGTGAVPVHGAVLSVDASPDVRAARAALDADPCDMTARSALVKAINQYVSAQVGDRRAQITSVVMVGGDDILPLAPVAEHTDQFTEQSHADDLRRATAPDGSACPTQVADGAVDPCATPIEAAAATNHILSDDPYGLATAYDTLGGTLYMPSTGVGRLVETPTQIVAAIGRFTASDGVLQADSTLTGGYGAWSDLPAEVTQSLQWRSPTNTQLAPPWTKTDVASELFPAAGQSARVVSLNAHFDETDLLPGIPGAADDVFAPSDLFSASSVTDPQAISGSLVFTIGCHAANNLPSSYYGPLTDWVDVFQNAGGFIGNTGYGLASDTTSALGERLLALYSEWIGVTAGGSPVTSAGALMQAKHAYLGQLGLYSGYDEKALMEAVYYGLPMYTFANSTKEVPLPAVPSDLTAVRTTGDLSAASLSLKPSFQQQTTADGSYVTADGEAPAVVDGQPVLPKVTRRLNPAPDGMKARGALIRGLTSEIGDALTPLIAQTSAGVDSVSNATRSDVAFPSTFAHITTQQTPTGPVDLLVVTPALVRSPIGGTGTIERFTDMGIDVQYGDASSTDDTDPVITAPGVERRGDTTTLYALADGTGSTVAAVIALVQPAGSSTWQEVPLAWNNGDIRRWEADIPLTGTFRWFIQAVDAAGNVGIDTSRGHIAVGGAAAPVLGAAGPDVTLATGDRLTRTIDVTDATPGEQLLGTFAVTSGGSTASSGAAVVATGADGRTRATIDTLAGSPGMYTVTLDVCRAQQCATTSFALTVPVVDHPPTAETTLGASTDPVTPATVLTARATGADADGDAVTLAYRWLRNGVAIDGRTDSVLALDGLAVPGDTITLEVTPTARGVSGGAARASATVVAVAPPEAPTIIASAKSGGKPYVAGTWSRKPVVVTFTCQSGAPVATCPARQTISADTPAAGVEVTGTTTDELGRTATTSLLVKLDRTAPALHPTVAPNPVVKGGKAVASANAVDAGSGVATQSCRTPSTKKVGSGSVTCTATDAAGNTAKAKATYRVVVDTAGTCKGLPSRTALPPVNADGSSVFLRLSAIPIVFRACDAKGRPIGTKGFVKSVTQVSATALPATAKVNEFVYLLPKIKPQYVAAGKVWFGAIGSYSLARGKKYTYRVSLADGTSFTFAFGVR